MEHANFTGKQIMEVQALYDLAYTTLRNLQKASAHVHKYIKEDGTPKASGHSIEEVTRLLLFDDMYMKLKGKPSMGEEDLSDNESEENDGTENEANKSGTVEDGTNETDAKDGTNENGSNPAEANQADAADKTNLLFLGLLLDS
jgi:hypothetical protein